MLFWAKCYRIIINFFLFILQSFVAKVASRVSELLPQRTWLNKWLSPAEVEAHHHVGSSLPTSTPLINSHLNLSHEHGPIKRPRLPLNSPPPFTHNKFLQSSVLHGEYFISYYSYFCLLLQFKINHSSGLI